MSSTLEAKKAKILNFKGPICAPVAPFYEDGELNVSVIPKYVEYLVSIGVKGLYICGTTGEVFNLTLDEKLRLIGAYKIALDSLPGSEKLLTMVLVSATSIKEVLTLSAKVEALGFDCLALLPPIYYTANSKRELLSYVKTVAQQGAPNTPLLYYHSPLKTGELKFELGDFVGSALETIPQFAAVKFSDPNIVRYEAVNAKYGEKVRFFAGMNEILLPVASYGVQSAICSSFSLENCVSAYISLLKAVERGDLVQAAKDQRVVAQTCARLRATNYFGELKKQLNADLGKLGLNFGKPRAPVLLE